MPNTDLSPQKKDSDWVERARRVIPGGMYGHMSVQRMMPEGYPQFFESAKGCHIRDTNGREYIDLMCAYGPMILGYQHPEVEDAVDTQRAKGNVAPGPSPILVELAEAYCQQISHADWSVFAKNGTDATTICVTTARAGTGKKTILTADGAYHGAAPWCTPMPAGVLDSDRAHIQHYTYNDAESLIQAARACQNDLAGIIVSAFKHDAFTDQAMPTQEFAKTARQLCDESGAALILDEVRAGFRLSLDSSWDALGIAPDLSAWSKAIANGYPIAAVLGNDRFRSAASKIYTTGSFWFEATPMAAALKTLALIKQHNVPERLIERGDQLRQGLAAQAQRYGHSLRQTGPVQMPMWLFDDDQKLEKGFKFCQEVLDRGIYIHPWHNHFLCLAHDEAIIDQVLQATDSAFSVLPSG